MAEDIQYPQFSADGLPITYVPDPFKADGAPVSNQWKDPARVATTGDITLSGLQTVDGISVMEGDRVLVKEQVAPAENGVWIVSAGAWLRAPDMYLWPQFVAAVVAIEEGTMGGRVYATDVSASGTVGTTPVYWVPVSGSSGSLPTFTPLRAIVTDAGGSPVASPTTSQEIAYVSGVTSSVQDQFAALDNKASSAFTIAVAGTNAAATATSTANAAYTLAVAGTNIGSLAYTVATALGDKYVRTTRFASIVAGTSGTVTLPANATVVLDDFGGATDAVITTLSAGRPTFSNAFTATGFVVTTTFDSSGAYTLSGAPNPYPVALVYRVRQKLSEFDSTSTNIIGEYDVEPVIAYDIQNVFEISGTFIVPATPAFHVYLVDTSPQDTVIVLPDATGWRGSMLHVKKVSTDVNEVILRSATGTQTVDAELQQSFVAPFLSLQLTANGTNWFIL